MNVGKALWEIGFADGEMARISHALQDESSINYRVFADHYKAQKAFDDICHKMTRTITGFRPTADAFRKRVYSAILKDLRQNKAQRDYWLLYQCCVSDFVIGKLSALNQLLSDTEVPDGVVISTDSILSLIADHAADYSVHDRDVEAIYDLWPFERTPKIRGYLSQCPKFDRFRAIDETVKSVEARLIRDSSELKAHNAQEIHELKVQLRSRVVSKKDFEEAFKSQKMETKSAIESVEARISLIADKLARFDKLIRRSEIRRTAERKEFAAETERQVDKLTQAINQVRNEQDQLSNSIEEFAANKGQTAPSPTPLVRNTASPFSLLEQSQGNDDRSSLSVAEALERFVSLGKAGDSETENQKIFFYTALLANCLLVLDRKEIEIWELVVGWCLHSVTVCASPLWVDERVIAEHLFWLFSNPDEPRCLIILDFDKGYVEGYLAPFLRAWRHSTQGRPWKKILLFPSGTEWTLPHHVASEIAVLPKVVCDSAAFNNLQSKPGGYVSPAKVKKHFEKIGYDLSKRASQSRAATNGDSGGLKSEDFAQQQIIQALPLGADAEKKLALELSLFWNERCTQ